MSSLTAYSRAVSQSIVVRDSTNFPLLQHIVDINSVSPEKMCRPLSHMRMPVPLHHLAHSSPFDIGDWGQFIDIDTSGKLSGKRTRVENLSQVQVYGNKVYQQSMDFDDHPHPTHNDGSVRSQCNYPITYMIEHIVLPVINYFAAAAPRATKPKKSDSCLMLCDSVKSLSHRIHYIEEENPEDLWADSDADTDTIEYSGLWSWSTASMFAYILDIQPLKNLGEYKMGIGKMTTTRVAAVSIVSMAAVLLICI